MLIVVVPKVNDNYDKRDTHGITVATSNGKMQNIATTKP